MKELDFEVWDVFTDMPFAGNPLAIVTGADGLSTEQMQVMAREFNLSETIFLMAPRDPNNTVRARIFFPAAEIPFAGHPTVGAALMLAGKYDLADVTLEEEAGLVPVTVSNGIAQFQAPVIPFPHSVTIETKLAAQALDIDVADIGAHSIGVHEGGPKFLYVPVKTRDTLRRARPIEPFWSELMTAAGVDSAYLYTPEFSVRMFSPTAGIPEDPATGSASALLASQLLANGAINDGENRFALIQGEDMGRPSQISLTVTAQNGAIEAVHVAGRAVPISSGRIRVPV
ncbi:MAG: PhzF family phenazine biosynthesis protein [Sulfitobacter sp.]